VGLGKTFLCSPRPLSHCFSATLPAFFLELLLRTVEFVITQTKINFRYKNHLLERPMDASSAAFGVW